MNIKKILLLSIMILFCNIQILCAFEVKHRIGFETAYLWGENTYDINFSEGRSKLEWPIELYLFGVNYTVNIGKNLEIEASCLAGPERSSSEPMKDSDWLDEEYYRGHDSHSGLDIYSHSDVDNKGRILDIKSRIFLLSTRRFSLGLTGGYQYQQFDYRGYDTTQTGYGPWSDRSTFISGPVITYEVEYSSWSVGTACRAALSDRISMQAEISYLTHVHSQDKDDHLKRNKNSIGHCSGQGLMLNLLNRFQLTPKWDIQLLAESIDINTKGDQRQYWYGDDPASPAFDDIGNAVSNIPLEIDQQAYRLGIGLNFSF